MQFLKTCRLARAASMLGRAECGVSAIEFSLVAPSLFILLYGFVEIGRALFCYNSLSHAVYEASRYAIVHGSESSSPADTAAITTQVEEAATGLDLSALTVATTWTPDNNPGSEVTVVATYQFAPLLTAFGFEAIELEGSMSMVIAR